MTNQVKLKAVMAVLNQQDAPISMGELLQLLDYQYAERSVRCWI